MKIEDYVKLLRQPGGQRSAMSKFRSALAAIVPEEEDLIRRNVMANIDEIVDRSIAGGQSFDPRTGRFIETMYSPMPVEQQDVGTIMAPRPEMAGARTTVAADPAVRRSQVLAAVLNAMQNPQMVNRLRRGDLLGSWVSGDEFVVDPSRLYMSEGGAIARGIRSNQDAGFAPRSGEVPVYVTNAAGQRVVDPVALAKLRQYRIAQLKALGVIGGTGSLGGALALNAGGE